MGRAPIGDNQLLCSNILFFACLFFILAFVAMRIFLSLVFIISDCLLLISLFEWDWMVGKPHTNSSKINRNWWNYWVFRHVDKRKWIGWNINVIWYKYICLELADGKRKITVAWAKQNNVFFTTIFCVALPLLFFSDKVYFSLSLV